MPKCSVAWLSMSVTGQSAAAPMPRAFSSSATASASIVIPIFETRYGPLPARRRVETGGDIVTT
ncbi:MAG: hypothetical protein QM765_19655 [Myxococcales bacterium]